MACLDWLAFCENYYYYFCYERIEFMDFMVQVHVFYYKIDYHIRYDKV